MSSTGFYTPQQITENMINAGVAKTKIPFGRMVLLGIFAGMFVACGASSSSVGMHAMTNVGLQRLVGGCIFPIGLMMIILVGGELFTGDCLMIMGCMHRKYSAFDVLRVLTVVYASNLIGSVLIAFLVYASGQLGYTDGLLGAFTIKIAMGKFSMDFGTAFASGIMCNIFVCLAVLMAGAAKDAAGKVLTCFFPVMAFVVSGYEHCVANMYYIPAGILAAGNERFLERAMEEYGYTAEQLSKLNWINFFVVNQIPVTLGNLAGGMIFVGVILYVIHAKSLSAGEKK